LRRAIAANLKTFALSQNVLRPVEIHKSQNLV
jgi:hypothetical protein